MRILRRGFLVGVLALAFAPQSVRADTILYATDFANSRIWSVDVTNGTNTLVTQTPGRADSLIFGPNGNLIYSLLDTGQLGTFNGTTNTILVGGLGQPADLTLEPSRNSVLIADHLGGRILRYVLGAPNATTLASGLFRVDGLTYDNSGKLFAVIGQNAVAQIDPLNGHIIKERFLGGARPDGITFDPVSGALWVSDRSGNALFKVPTDLTSSTVFAAGLIPLPDGLESDGSGNIFVAASGTNVYEYNIAGNIVTQENAVPGLDDLAPLTGLGAPTPEPGSLLLFGSGFLTIAGYFRRRPRTRLLSGRPKRRELA